MNPRLQLLISLLLLSLMISCNRSYQRLIIQDQTDLTEKGISIANDSLYGYCEDNLSYAPYEDQLAFMDPRIIRINFHFMDNQGGEHNLTPEESKDFVYYLVQNANKRLKENFKSALPENNDIENLQPLYQYRLVPSEDNKVGIYHHYDDELYYFLNKGKNRNNYDTKVIEKYALQKDTVLNIFIIPQHPDSVLSTTYNTYSSGIALGKAAKLGAVWSERQPAWGYATLLNHEIGHVMGLSHAWYKNDGCDDTPAHPNCYGPGPPPCDGPISNNMMDYNGSQMAITPCQLGRIHKNISKERSLQRDLVQEDWCQYIPNDPIIVDRDMEIKGARDIRRDVLILPGATLKIQCRLSLAASSKIMVSPGAKLILNHARLHNSCGDTWQGIELIKEGDLSGEVLYYGDNSIENTETANGKS